MPGALSLGFIVGLSVLGAWGAARAERCRAARLTMLGVLSFTVTVLGAQVLGLLAAITKRPLLGPWSLTLAVLGFTALVWVFARARGVPAAAPAGRRHGGLASHLPMTLVAVLGLASIANGVLLGLSNPPREWDVLTYHLPRAVAWLQHGNLGHYGFSAAFYPGNGEIPLLAALFWGSDRLATVVQLPFALLGAVALYGLAREIGATRRSAPLAPLAFLVTPIVVFQTSTAMNDLTTAGVILAGVYLLVRALRPLASARERRLSVATGGLAFGLALGTKYTVLPFVVGSVPAVALSLAAVWVLGTVRPDRGSRSAWAPVARRASGFALRETTIFVAALALPSVFWFAQNWIATGNPFAPVLVRLGQWTVFNGIDVASAYGSQQLAYVPVPIGWWVFPWVDRWLMHGTYSGSVGFGAVFAAFAIPAVAVLGRGALKRRAGEADLRAPLLFAFVVLGVAAWWFGGFHLPRYLWPFLALLYAPVALLFDEVRGRGRALMVGMFAVAALFSSLETVRLIHAGNDFLWSRVPWGTTKREYYHIPDLIYRLPAGTRILLYRPTDDYYCRLFRYPLIGDLPGNDVIMAGDVGVRLAEAGGDTASLHNGIRRERIEYIFSRTLTSPPIRLCFDDCPNRYEQLVATLEPQYRWHRRGIPVHRGTSVVRDFPVVTKIYRVLGN